MEPILSKHSEERILKRLRGLPRRQLEEVVQFIDFITERARCGESEGGAADLRETIIALRRRGKGEHLVERLLQSRREDRRYDDRR